MEIKVTAKHGEISKEVQDKITRKASKLNRIFDRTTGINVVCDMGRSEPRVEMIVSAEETNDFFASSNGSNVIVATDLVIGKIEQQLRKHKEKLTEHHRGKNPPIDHPADELVDEELFDD